MFTHVRIIVENYGNGRGEQVKTPRPRTDLTKRPKSTKHSTMYTWPFCTKFELLTSRRNRRGIGAERKLDLEQNQIPATDCGRVWRSWGPPPYHRVDKAAAVSDSTRQMFFFLTNYCGIQIINGGNFHPAEATTSKRRQIHIQGTEAALIT